MRKQEQIDQLRERVALLENAQTKKAITSELAAPLCAPGRDNLELRIKRLEELLFTCTLCYDKGGSLRSDPNAPGTGLWTVEEDYCPNCGKKRQTPKLVLTKTRGKSHDPRR